MTMDCGTDHSSHILLLPTEILLEILFLLDLTDILTLRLVNLVHSGEFCDFYLFLYSILTSRHAPRCRQ